MTLAITLVIAAVLALVYILYVTHSGSLQVCENSTSETQLTPIDVEAFRNLVDPAEAEYLRRRLPAPEFRRVQRERLLATAAYVRVALRNAAILLRMAEGSLSSADADTAEAARQLVDQAFLLRCYATVAFVKIYVAWAWPTTFPGALPLLHGYERLSGSAMLLGRLQNPAAPVRISAS